MSLISDISTRVKKETNDFFAPGNPQRTPVLILIGLIVLVTFSYYNSIAMAAIRWTGAEYSHAWMIPIASVVFLLLRRQEIDLDIKPWQRWTGVGLVASACIGRAYFSYIPWNVPDMYTYLVALLGIFMLVGGLNMIKWSAAPIIFLVFMFPLPDLATHKIRTSLQGYATVGSHYVMQTVGIDSYREGNNIRLTDSMLNEIPLTVAEQCSGLRMLTIFIALSVAIAMMYRGAWWERLVIVLSAVPIALVVNIIRIALTGICFRLSMSFEWISREFVGTMFHDYAGYFMVPMAFGFLYLELVIMANLFIEDEPHDMSLNMKQGVRSINGSKIARE